MTAIHITLGTAVGASGEGAGETTAEPEDILYPPAEDAEGLVDVELPDRNVPIDPLPERQVGPIANYYFINLGKTGTISPTGDFYDGSAVGVYFEADVLGLLKVRSRKLGAVYMPKNVVPNRTQGDDALVASAHPELWPVPYLEVRGIESRVRNSGGCCGVFRANANATTKIARLKVGDLDVEGIEVTALAHQVYPTNEYETTAEVRFARIKFGTTVYNYPDIAPNTTYNVAGLGKVVLNERKITEKPGERHAAKVNAIHITLSTSKLGLPVGTDIYIGSAEAVVDD